MNRDLETRKSEYRLAAVAIVALFAAIIVIWQWIATVHQIDALEQGQESRFSAVLKDIKEARTNKQGDLMQ